MNQFKEERIKLSSYFFLKNVKIGVKNQIYLLKKNKYYIKI